MNEVTLLLILYVAGVATLVADIFLPSHAILTALGVGLLGVAIYRTFQIGETAGWVGLVSCLVVLPTSAYVGVKNWYRTPFGKRIAPPNPTLTVGHIGPDMTLLHDMIGQNGRAVSTLRPIGICEFQGHRLSCVAESGMIDPTSKVVGVGIRGTNLMVRTVDA